MLRANGDRRPDGWNVDRNKSHLLQDFLANRLPNLSLSDIASHVAEFARCNRGSKFIQKKLGDATVARKNAVFNELQAELYDLCTDPSANFVVQKFFEIGTSDHKLALINFIMRTMWLLSSNLYGCRVVQKAIEKASLYEKSAILVRLQTQVVDCAKNPYGNHVIQNSFRLMPANMLDFLVFEMLGNIMELCTHLYGCRVVQRALEMGTDNQKKCLFEAFAGDILMLVKDRYGNYVVQQVLLYGIIEDNINFSLSCLLNINLLHPLVVYGDASQKNQIVQTVMDNIENLSSLRYASNAVEKCFQAAGVILKSSVVDKFAEMDPGSLKKNALDPYANYVLQRIIEASQPAQLHMLFNKLQPQFKLLARHTCGRSIITLLKSLRDRVLPDNSDVWQML